jgi:hypothetical protein
MEKHMLMCFFMSMLCGKIKFETDINNDEQLKTIWKKYKVGGMDFAHFGILLKYYTHHHKI